MKELNKLIEEKLNEGRSYRVTQVIEIRSEDDDSKIVEGYATTFNDPYELWSYDNWEGYRVTVKERVDPEAFAECDMRDVIMQYDHEGRVFARIRNNTLAVQPDNHGLHIRANLGGTELGRQLYEEIAGGYTDRMSFGFTVGKDSKIEERDDENKIITVTRTILKITKLWDVSAVSLPANDATEISARSFCDGVIAELTEEFRKAEEIKRKKLKIRILMEV